MVLSGCLILLSSFPVFVWGFSSQQLVKHLLYSRHSSQVGAGMPRPIESSFCLPGGQSLIGKGTCDGDFKLATLSLFLPSNLGWSCHWL